MVSIREITMKEAGMAYVGWAVMWVACCALIGFAVYWTHSAVPMWALLIPGGIELRTPGSGT